METKNTRGSPQRQVNASKGNAVNSAKGQITMFFNKKDKNQESAQKTLTPQQRQAIPEIKQSEPVTKDSPTKDQGKRSSNVSQKASKPNALNSTSEETPNKGAILKPDVVDKEASMLEKQIKEELINDPVELAKKRDLRPRETRNYKNMFEGGEIYMKTIQDEQIEIRQKLKEEGEDLMDEDEQICEDGIIERASDDDESDEDYGKKSSPRGKRKAKKDEEMHESDLEPEESDDDVQLDEFEPEDLSQTAGSKRKSKSKDKKKAKKSRNQVDDADLGEEIEEEQTVFIDNLPNDENEIKRMLKDVKKHIKNLEKQFFEEEDSEQEEELKNQIPAEEHDEKLFALQQQSHIKQFWCIPLSVNVLSFKFEQLAEQQKKLGGRLFDVITIDPPWQLSSANPTRGVAIAYDTLNDRQILDLPFSQIQTDGFLFIWVINAKYRFALEMMEKFGYKLVDEITWVKQTVNGKIAKGHGYYLQHAKETCLVGVKGNVKGKAKFNIESDVIFSQRRGQSQKPEEIYEIAEALVPNGYYLEIFGRRNNLHNGWVTVGNEI